MKLKDKYKSDIEFIMSKRHVNGSDLWAGEENHIGKGGPFSTRDVSLILVELGFNKKDRIIQQLAELILEHQQPDGRFKVSRSGAIYPCHTIGCLRVLCYLGYAKDRRLKKTFDHLFAIQEKDGGWKCNKFSYGRGPETDYSNPGPTLEALDALRYIDRGKEQVEINRAIAFLLWHWEHKKPIGPCQFGIGTLFNKTEFPFFRYNLFYYTYVLSFYQKSTNDRRFRQALAILERKIMNEKIVIENPNRQLGKMKLCTKGSVSEAATRRYNEIKMNI